MTRLKALGPEDIPPENRATKKKDKEPTSNFENILFGATAGAFFAVGLVVVGTVLTLLVQFGWNEGIRAVAPAEHIDFTAAAGLSVILVVVVTLTNLIGGKS